MNGASRSGLTATRVWATLVVATSFAVGIALIIQDRFEAEVFLFVLAAVAYSYLGLVMVARQPGNRVAWLLFVVATWVAVTGLTELRGVRDDVPPNPVALWDVLTIMWGNVAYFVALLLPLLLFLYVFPTGRFLTRRWSWAGWVVGGISLLAIASQVFAEQVGPDGAEWTVANPIGFLENMRLDEGVLGAVFGFGFVAVGLGAIPAIIVRYRRSDALVRTQIRWVVYAMMLMIGSLILNTAFGTVLPDWADSLLFVVLMMAVPVSVTVAITRYRLFDIDRLISRTLAYALVVAALTIAYLAVVLGVGAVAAAVSPSDADLPIPVLATALVAVGFQPVRKRALGVADRLVFGKQRTPYEALAGIKEVELDDLLPQVAQLVTQSTAARGAIVWLSTGTELEPAAVFPEGTKTPGSIHLENGQIPASVNSGEVFPMLYQGSLIGAITTLMDPGEELPAVDVRLLKDLSSHAVTTIKGVLDATPLPDGIVTFLMTDIEASTSLWEQDPDRMAVSLRKHDELVQHIIRDGGGVLVKWKGEGDSTFSVFTDPGEAVEAAMALHDAIQGYQWDLVRPISIRAALHTGEAELRERDYYGQTVNRCARIRSLAHGGQTLVSAATRELVRSVAFETLTFKDLGEHQLRGFQEPERVYEVTDQTEARPTEPKQAAEI